MKRDNVFCIICEGSQKSSKLVTLGKYDWWNDLITDKLFPIREHVPRNHTIELVELDCDLTLKEVLAKFSRRNLKRPTYEDALYFGIEYPEEQRKHPIVFPHEPVLAPYYGHSMLVLSESRQRERHLNLGWFDDKWPQRYVFAAILE